MRCERRFTGLPVSGGVVLARVHILAPREQGLIPSYQIAQDEVAKEIERLENAIRTVIGQLDTLVEEATKRVGTARANIFVAQKLMAGDASLHREIMARIASENLNAETAVDYTLNAYESLLREVDNEYMKERSSDIGEIRQRLLNALLRSAQPLPRDDELKSEEYHILAAEELTPSETMALDTACTAGFITERGGPVSHVAILARALGIPAVSGVKAVYASFSEGEEVLLNGDTGEIIAWPSESTLRVYPAMRKPSAPRLHRVEHVPGFNVMANINLSDDITLVNLADAEGIGLYRTELELLAANRFLSEEEQFTRYERVCTAMKGSPVFIRLFDLGGDKSAGFLALPQEENPALGYRGARLLLDRPELLGPQVRALARASCITPIHLIYPMIIDHDQFLRLRQVVKQHIQDLPHGTLYHGVMIEVPSAFLDARNLFRDADFACIGSNDLVQYLFAVDRNNSMVARDYSLDHPILWASLRQLLDEATACEKPISVCGEIASHPAHLSRLIQMGYRKVSVNPRFIGLCRKTAVRTLRAL